MADTSDYMDGISALRALLVSPEDALSGKVLLSIETQSEFSDETLGTYLENNFGTFLHYVRYFPPEDQTMLLSYYLLKIPQTLLALRYNETQTTCSFRLRTMVGGLMCLMAFEGLPSEEQMRPLIEKTGRLYNHATGETPLSRLVSEYFECRSYAKIAKKYNLHRPSVRRVIRAFSKVESDDPSVKALVCLVASLQYKSSATGTGVSEARKARTERISYVHDPDTLGQFRVVVGAPDWEANFTPKSSQ